MMYFGQCPRCGTEIDHNRMVGASYVCACGWHERRKTPRSEHNGIESGTVFLFFVATLIVALFLQAVNWDRHFFAIIPLKVKQLVGSATTQDLEQISSICEERQKTSCVEEALFQLTQLQPSNLNVLARLGRLQFQRERWTQASSTFAQYFTQRGADLEAAYDYARVLGHQKKFQEAGQYFEFAMKASPTTLQINVTRSYVQMLMAANRLTEAKSAILNYRRQSASANLFMNKELQDIRGRLGEMATTASAVSTQ